MEKREIKLAGGRCLIFYTFDEQPAPTEDEGVAESSEPELKLEAEEERRV